MTLTIGDRITYEPEFREGECVQGRIIAVAENRVAMVTTYLAQLISGEYVQIKPDNLNRCKLDKPDSELLEYFPITGELI